METTRKLPRKTMETDPITKALRLSSTKLPIIKASIESHRNIINLLISILRDESLDTESSSFKASAWILSFLLGNGSSQPSKSPQHDLSSRARGYALRYRLVSLICSADDMHIATFIDDLNIGIVYDIQTIDRIDGRLTAGWLCIHCLEESILWVVSKSRFYCPYCRSVHPSSNCCKAWLKHCTVLSPDTHHFPLPLSLSRQGCLQCRLLRFTIFPISNSQSLASLAVLIGTL